MIFLYANRAMVIFHNPAHNRKAEPGAAFLGREVRQEQLLFKLPRDAMTGVCNSDFNRVAAADQGGSCLLYTSDAADE